MKTRLLYGDRIGKSAPIRIGCSAAIFDPSRSKMLLIQRSDNGLWSLPAGGMEPGESFSEACEREVREETGLTVKVKGIIGVYSTPHRIVEYPDGKRFQIVAIHFEAEVVEGDLSLSDETTGVGFFTLDEMKDLVVMDHSWERINDSFSHKQKPFIR